MSKTPGPRPKPPTEFEQIPVAVVKKIADRRLTPAAGQTKRPVREKFIRDPAVEGVNFEPKS